MGHTSYFSALSNYSLQIGNWHPSPSMSVLLLHPAPSGVGGNLDPTDLGSGLLPRPGCPPQPPPTPSHSLSPPDHSPQGLLPRPGCPHPSHSLSTPPHSPPQIVPHRGCRPHPNGCSLLSMSLEQFSQWKDVLSHGRCQLRGQQNSGSWTHGAHFLLTSDEDVWSQWR